MCVVAEMSFAFSSNRHKAPLTITNSLRTAPDTPNLPQVSSPEVPSIHIYRTTLSHTAEGEDHNKAQYLYTAYNTCVILWRQAATVSSYFHYTGHFPLCRIYDIIFNPSTTLRVKFQLLPWTKTFGICNTLKFTHDPTVHQGEQNVMN
jgi:hypothetical protein